MAKVKSSGLRNYIGKLGGNVYYMRAGQNIARELAAQVSNPRTAAQMGQRTALANLVRFYQVSKAWMEARAFEFRKPNQSVYNALVSANITSTPVYLDKGDVENGVVVAAPYRVADGSLPTIGAFYDSADNAFKLGVALGDLSFGASMTIAEFSAAVIGSNTSKDWQEGDQLSIIIYSAGELIGTGQYQLVCRPYEVILDTEDARLFSEVYAELYSILNKDADSELALDDLGTIFDMFDEQYGYSVVTVHSRTYKGATTVSRETLALDTDAADWLDNYTGEAAKRRAGRSYGERAEYFLDAQRVNASDVQPTRIVNVNGVPANGYVGPIGEDSPVNVNVDQPLTGASYTVKVVCEAENYTIGTDVAPIDSTRLYFESEAATEAILSLSIELDNVVIATINFSGVQP